MRISLNELSITSYKAALGVGVCTGAAEDLAKAVSWLVVRQLPVVRSVLDGLDAVDTTRSVFGDASIEDTRIDWYSLEPDKTVSAALIGGAASDLLLSLNLPGKASVCIQGLDCPLLLLPHFSTTATNAGLNLRILWASESAEIELIGTDDYVHIMHDEGDPLQCGRYKLEAVLEKNDTVPPSSQFLFQGTREPDVYMQGCEVDEPDWVALAAFADRILVKATERSRAVGAGAGVSDND